MTDTFPYFGEILAFLCAIAWAFAVIMFKKSGETVHPIALNLFKGWFAVVLFIPTAILLDHDLLYPASPEIYVLLAVSGIIGVAVADTLYFKALNQMPAGLVAIVACLYSPTIITLSVIFLGESLTWLQILGAVLIVFAVSTGISREGLNQTDYRKLLMGFLWGTLAVICNAVGIVMIIPVLEKSPLLWVTEVRLLAGSLALALILFFFPSRKKILKSLHTVRSWKYTLLGSFFGAYLAMVLWLGGMKFTQASIAAALNQTSNLFVFLFAALILKEKINAKRAIGIVMAVGGAILVSFG